jgi:hypothetical protein
MSGWQPRPNPNWTCDSQPIGGYLGHGRDPRARTAITNVALPAPGFAIAFVRSLISERHDWDGDADMAAGLFSCQ